MDKAELIDQILLKWSLRTTSGIIDLNDLTTFKAVLNECVESEELRNEIYNSFLKVEVADEKTDNKTESITVDEETYALAKDFGFLGKYEDVKNIDISQVSKIKYNTAAGVLNKSITYYDDFKKFILSQNVIYITKSKTVAKVRDFLNKRIAQLNPQIFINFYGLVLIYRENPDIFSFKKVDTAGVNYELQRVEELNGYLSNLIIPKQMYIRGGTDAVYNANVSVNGAIKIPGVGKADIALTSKGQEVFWISYKHGAFFKSDVKELAKVAFQQYGSLQSLYELSEKTTNEKSFEEFKFILDGFLANVIERDKADIIINVVNIDLIEDEDIVVITKDDNTKIYYAKVQNPKFPTAVIDIDKFDKLYKKGGMILNELRSTRNRLNIVFYKQGNNYFYDYTRTKEFGGVFSTFEGMKNIVGKSIYGNDFTINNKVFGRENVNVLVQTDKNFVLQPYPYPDGDTVLINVDKTGHVLYNPNFPNEQLKDIKDLVEKYLPVIVCRYGEKESFRFKNSAGNNVFLGCRVLVMPKEKAGSAIEIKNL